MNFGFILCENADGALAQQRGEIDYQINDWKRRFYRRFDRVLLIARVTAKYGLVHVSRDSSHDARLGANRC